MLLSINSSYLSFRQAFIALILASATTTTLPPEDWVKTNFDATMQDSAIVTAVIYQNSTSTIIGIETMKHHLASALMSECLAARLSIELALSLIISHLILKCDAKVVIQNLDPTDEDRE
ncbi:hypothetical protein PanWU01x14_098380 [Parasponia andersonii]|uniref:RNase H type-1 domain-containing protein n=1 Tax=Parasponia andersonii TaxID=3476 RepID=A0A2P5D405_PARAD|nr:hypothetical protein PanWU01x14_098380 [Parasponia andersonii]